MSNRLPILMALAVAVFVAAFYAETASATPYFSLDRLSPSLRSGETAGDLFRSPKALSLSHAALGLPQWADVDGISQGTDSFEAKDPCEPNVYYWSVDRKTQGSPTGGSVNSAGGPCFSMGQPELLEAQHEDAAGDVFVQTWGPQCLHPACQAVNQRRRVNALWRDEHQLGLHGRNADELDALEVNTRLSGRDKAAQDVYFSVAGETAASLGVSGADVLYVAADSNSWKIRWRHDELGLVGADDIDALCVNASTGTLLFSLAPASPSLHGVFSTADVFKVRPGVDEFPGTGVQVPWLPAQFLSLLRTDNVDGLDCTLQRVKKRPKWPVAGADCTPALQFVDHGQQAIINVVALPGSAPILGTALAWVGPDQPAGIVQNGNAFTVMTNPPPGPFELHILAINVFFGAQFGIQQVICGVVVRENVPVPTTTGRPEYPPVATGHEGSHDVPTPGHTQPIPRKP